MTSKIILVLAIAAAFVVGSFLSQNADPNILKIMYGALMLILTYIMLRRPSTKEKNQMTKDILTGKFEYI